jgi:glutamine amidotransferase
MAALTEGGLADAIGAAAAPLLGVCLGMQLLFEHSLEGDTVCLGLLAGGVEPMTWAPQVPHMGWNDVQPANDHSLASALPAVCYFAHSYAVSPDDRSVVVAETEVGGRSVPSVIADGRVAGVQFHPEKSGPAGRALLEEWLRDAA